MSYSTLEQLIDFYNRFNNVPSCDYPNWMLLKFQRLLPELAYLDVMIDHKDPEARKELGALISRLWLVREEWKITTERP